MARSYNGRLTGTTTYYCVYIYTVEQVRCFLIRFVIKFPFIYRRSNFGLWLGLFVGAKICKNFYTDKQNFLKLLLNFGTNVQNYF